ncbi:hypothetical protein NPIL_634951 [Nephila pilipes]|uniref:Uncharacterized protein n=1 Tax=Nephila pilipes TaxID=299642 RepID=A0A8X6Q499_NEPPI|nr:hypothetical protein NPIL_634951 [Nephila pilipes]
MSFQPVNRQLRTHWSRVRNNAAASRSPTLSPSSGSENHRPPKAILELIAWLRRLISSFQLSISIEVDSPSVRRSAMRKFRSQL